MIDLGAALDAAPAASTGTGSGRCVIGRMLDSVPDDTPRRDELVTSFETPGRRGRLDDAPPGYRRNSDLVTVAGRLGVPVSKRTVSDHRARSCRCYVGAPA